MTTRVLRTAAMHGVRYPELVTKTSSRGVPGGRSPGQIPHVSGPDGMLGPLRAAQPEPGERVFATDEVPAIWSGDAVQRPPRLLLTLLGDYWWRRTEPLPSAALVALLAEFAVSDSAARAALSRLTRNRLLITSKSVRPGYWTTAAVRSSRSAGRHSHGMGCGASWPSPSPNATVRPVTRCASSCGGWGSHRSTTDCGSRPGTGRPR